MTWSSRVVVGTVVLCALCGVRADAAPGRNGQERPVDHTPVTRTVSLVLGRIAGAVTDPAGMPLDGAVISAFGPAGPEMALADADGRFMLPSLAPGSYLVQAHLPGFAASPRELVDVSARTPTVHVITLSRVGQVEEPIAASAGLPIRADTGAPPDEAVLEAAGTETSAPHDHGVKAWRLRRARRSVLKDAAAPLPTDESSSGRVATRTSSFGAPARFVRGLLDLPLSGEVNLLTRGTIEGAPDSIAGVPGSAGIANLSVGAPVWQGAWVAQGALSAGDLTSWVLSGAYLADADTAHRLGFTVSYGRQRYGDENQAALAVASESRYAASVGASDSWVVSSRLRVDYGGRYATYGHTEKDGLFSPRVGVTMTPVTGLRIRAGASQEMVAPGAEEFLPPIGTALWLPPERTSAAFSLLGGEHPERTRNVEVGLEVDLTGRYVAGVRRYSQDVSGQMATLFGKDELGRVQTGHYYMAQVGSVTSRGWVLTLRRHLGEWFSGSVDYSIADADWRQAVADQALGTMVAGATRPSRERFHDLSGAIEAEIPEFATRLFFRCRVNSAFVRVDGEAPIGLDARFDVRVNQPLPFSPFDGSRWEVLMVVRSLFFEPQAAASIFDELLVARAPTEFVGGLVVHF